jgi:hypothetical protein
MKQLGIWMLAVTVLLTGPAMATADMLTVVGTFNGSNGRLPYGGVSFDAQGNAYGTTLAGGAFFGGTVWKMASGSNTIQTVAQFNGTNGAFPLILQR